MAKYQRVKKCSKSFRPLSGNLLSLPYEFQFMKDFIELFSSPIGESTFSTTCGMRIENLENLEFSSPIGESTFSTKFYKGIVKETYRFRPLSGNLLSLHFKNNGEYLWLSFSSPIGESTFSTSFYPICVESLLQFSSPIGESTFSTRNNKIQEKEENDFRPLSGNLLSLQLDLSIDQIRRELIFVPYRGIYFLYKT